MISDGHTSVLLDAGLPFKEIQRGLGYHLSDIAAALVSHGHGDHSKAVADLASRGIEIYASEDTLQELDAVRGKFHARMATALMPRVTASIGSWQVMPFDVHHDVRNFGYLLESGITHERLVYITDTYYTDYTFPGVTHWMVECNYVTDIFERNVAAGAIPRAVAHRIPQSHMSLETVCDLFRANDMSRAREIYLLHCSDANGDEDRMKRAVQEIAGCPVYVA